MSDANPPEGSITLRDRFACRAMSGLLIYRGTDRKPFFLGRNAYSIADAMIDHRGADMGLVVTFRDRIAELAMSELVAIEGTSVKPAKHARMAYEIADNMLAARAEAETPPILIPDEEPAEEDRE